MILSKTLHPGDLDRLPAELGIVDRFFKSAREQHPARRWEYAMALSAIARWDEGSRAPLTVYDVGGAGSPFANMLRSDQVANIDLLRIVDPDLPAREGPATLKYELSQAPPLGHVVTCLSVLEHVEDLDEFCYHLASLTAPGGLLFLTVDYCSDRAVGDAVDVYHFHWMRRRIFSSYTLGAMTSEFFRRDFSLFGEADFTWHGAQVYDYSFASLALIKRP